MGTVAAYVRVSTQDQEAQGTQEAQTNAINAFCVSRGFQVQEWFQEQESTLNLERPEFQRLLEKLRAGEVSTIVVAALDRFSRDQIETLQTVELIKKEGASFYCIRDHINITNGQADFASEMVISVMSLFAKNERETIKARTMAGKKRKRAKGLWINAQAPCGYELDQQTKILQVNQEEAAIVRRICDEKLKGRGVNAILKNLTMDGVPLFEQRVKFSRVRYCQVMHRERSSDYCRIRPAHAQSQLCPQCTKQHGGTLNGQKLWPKNTISRILKNKVYLGLVPNDGEWIGGAHDPLVTKEEWDKVQKSFTERCAAKNKIYPNNPLAGMVRCGQCGRKMFVTTAHARRRRDGTLGPKWAAFRCPGFKGGICSQGGISIKIVQEQVYDYLDRLFLSGKVAGIIRSAFDALVKNWGSGDVEELLPLEEEVARLEREKKKLVAPIVEATERGFADLYRSLMDKAEAIDLRIKGLRNQAALIRFQADTQRADLERVPPEDIFLGATFAWLATQELAKTGESEELRNRMAERIATIARSLVKEVSINGDQVHIEPLLVGDDFEGVIGYLVMAVLEWSNVNAGVSDKAALARHTPS